MRHLLERLDHRVADEVRERDLAAGRLARWAFTISRWSMASFIGTLRTEVAVGMASEASHVACGSHGRALELHPGGLAGLLFAHHQTGPVGRQAHAGAGDSGAAS